jgi:hypothetical protein
MNELTKAWATAELKSLKVKVKSLAAEARIIRQEENKCGPKMDVVRGSLWNHRTHDVRREQRSSLIAYAFLRRKPYELAERNVKREPDWKRVAEIVAKFGMWSGHTKENVKAKVDEWRMSRVAMAA